MKIADLYYFKFLYETKSLQEVAQINCISKSKVLLSIKRLENELGGLLIVGDITSMNIKITKKGLCLLAFIDWFEENLNVLSQNLLAQKTILKIGIPNMEEISLIKTYLNELYKNYKNEILFINLNDELQSTTEIFNIVDCYFKCYRKYDIKPYGNRIFIKKICLEAIFNSKMKFSNIYSLNNQTIVLLNKKTFHYMIINSILLKFNIRPKKVLYLDSLEYASILIQENLAIGVFFEGLFDYNSKIKKFRIANEPLECYLEYSDKMTFEKSKLNYLNNLTKEMFFL